MKRTNRLPIGLLILTLVGILTGTLHFFLGNSPEELWDMMFPIYLFLWFLSGSLLIMVHLILQRDPQRGGMAYLIGSVVKMLLALIFLLPIIYGGHPLSKQLALQFLIPYGAFFLSEVLLVVRWVNRP
ncbi:MAG: hypothetical protein LPK46_05235 [Bacteroidota bacterium]|nr:hypothetical protein [Bacteroidota bacterium]